MGLDIVVYEKVQAVPFKHEYGEACYEADHIHVSSDQAFPRSLRGLELGQCYMSLGNRYSFRAGSYSGYGSFRGHLCEAALGQDPETLWSNPQLYQDEPFFELLNFYDNEGCIGPEACADLAQDFEGFRHIVVPKLKAPDEEDGTYNYYVSSYEEWAKAFKLTAGTGLVYFC
jgi:hypothetical protein